MSRTAESTHRLAELALASLKAHGLSATPRNFEVWYAHAEGKNPALSRDIQNCLTAPGGITQSHADGLFELHLVRADLSGSVLEIVSRFEDEVEDLSRLIEESGENAQGRQRELTDIAASLRDVSEDDPAIAKLLDSVIAVTKTVCEENLLLERRLADSCDEVIALRRRVEKIQEEAMTDPLTGIKNRKTFDAALEKLIDEAGASCAPLSLILGDIDHFKDFNDRYGHQTGDQVLRLVSEVLVANVKGQDVLARYGGEEFAILLPDTALEHAERLADRIRGAIESRRLKKRRTEEDLGVVTMSMGVAVLKPRDSGETLVERADECLYAAKRAGRNRVVSESALEPDSPRLVG